MGPPGLGRRQGEWAGCKTAVWVLNETGVPPFTPGDIYFLGSQTLMVGPEWASDSNKYFSVYLIFLFISFWYWHKWDPWFNSRSMICIITLLTASHKLHPDQWHISGQSVQSLSRVWLCDPMDCSTPAFPVHHQFLEFTQPHVHRVGDAIQPSHPLSSPSPPTFNLSQHQGLFWWVSSSHEVAKVLEFQLQHQPFQRTPRTDLL